jgi:hypothetical protein
MEVLNLRLSNSQRPGGSLTGDLQRGASTSATLSLSWYNHLNSPVAIYFSRARCLCAADPRDLR